LPDLARVAPGVPELPDTPPAGIAKENPQVKTVKLTRQQVAKWRRTGGNKCPHCRGSDLETVGRNGDADYLTHDIQCRGCGAEWTELYTLSGLVDNTIHVPDDAAGTGSAPH